MSTPDKSNRLANLANLPDTRTPPKGGSGTAPSNRPVVITYSLGAELRDLMAWLEKQAAEVKDIPATSHGRRRLESLAVRMKARAIMIRTLLGQQQTTEGGVS